MGRLSNPMGVLNRVLAFVFCVLGPAESYADSLNPESYGVRSRISEKTLLGKDAPEDFEVQDVSANFRWPWLSGARWGWETGSHLLVSAGHLRGAGKSALVVSAIPAFNLTHQGTRFTLDAGVGGALFSRYHFGTQDFGGPFQFALTVGIGVPVYHRLGIGYRFLHYSDAGVNGTGTTGADFHMIELSYGL